MGGWCEMSRYFETPHIRLHIRLHICTGTYVPYIGETGVS